MIYSSLQKPLKVHNSHCHKTPNQRCKNGYYTSFNNGHAKVIPALFPPSRLLKPVYPLGCNSYIWKGIIQIVSPSFILFSLKKPSSFKVRYKFSQLWSPCFIQAFLYGIILAVYLMSLNILMKNFILFIFYPITIQRQLINEDEKFFCILFFCLHLKSSVGI